MVHTRLRSYLKQLRSKREKRKEVTSVTSSQLHQEMATSATDPMKVSSASSSSPACPSLSKHQQTSSSSSHQQFVYSSSPTNSICTSDTNSNSVESNSPPDACISAFGSLGLYSVMEDEAASEEMVKKEKQQEKGLERQVSHQQHHHHHNDFNDPWFYPGMTREEANTSLSKYTSVEGVFLVRTSSTHPGMYVLSFTSRSKINHVSIQEVEADHGQIVLSIDGGGTKFYDLRQLIEFYQLNQGDLPTRLTHFLVHK